MSDKKEKRALRWTQSLNDFLLVIVAFTAAINAIATGLLIDMHTLQERRRRSS